MEGTIGEIRIFASNFAPRDWSFCAGQIMAISSNTALFSILGTYYGGDGKTTFALPDLRGRTAVGVGNGPGLTPYVLGEKAGVENVTLTVTEIPVHTHTAVAQGPGAILTLNGVDSAGGQSNPGGNFLGIDNGAGATSYASSGTPAAMNANSIKITGTTPLPTVSVVNAGNGLAHSNIQPSLSLYYIICTTGIFPQRN